MNQNQKYVLIGGVCVIIAAALYPPFYIDIPRLSTVNLGFSFVLDPPEYKRFRGSINVPLLLAEWAGTVLVCGALWFLFKDGDPAGPTKESPSRTDSKWDAPEPAASGSVRISVCEAVSAYPILRMKRSSYRMAN